MNIIKELETNVDWNRVFGVVDSLYSDEGFTSNADNFARATMVEKALDKFSNINRVDQNGYDFEWKIRRSNSRWVRTYFTKSKTQRQLRSLKLNHFLVRLKQ